MPSLFTFANNISTTLAGSLSSSATSLTLSSAANLPSSIPAGKVLAITLNDQATRQQFEVIYATAISGATLSGLLRNQEGTSAQAWSTGDYAYCSPTMGQMQAFGQLGDANTWTGQNTFNNPITVGNATAPGHALNLGQLPAQFPGSLTANGYKKIPDANSPSGYIIEQWGNGLFPTQLTTTGNFPLAFPNQVINFVCGLGSAISATAFTSVGGQAANNSQFVITVASSLPGSDAVWWRAIGY
ncbi:gp53-like domain-containing protein [Burkholderia multivorans]|uniref:gp53-like domain-containing protein n=1 Tax=Burkholderia multivorans TaxID=87883 RepID=UPI0011B27438|nr:hypothetical protein [Burkholderia multivorans]